MNRSGRPPSFWRRLVGKRRINSGPDFGDMGTAFGLDAIMPAIGDWQLVGTPSIEKTVSGSADAHPVHPAHAWITREPS
jgi:hypothetical protein